MKRLLLSSSARQLYGVLIAWGSLQGIVTYLVMVLVVPIGDRSIANAVICALGGSAISAVVFGLLLKARVWLQPVGFLVVGALLPYLVMIVWGSLDNRRLVVLFDPLATALTLLWTAYSLPFALFAAALYLSLLRFAKRTQPGNALPRAPTGSQWFSSAGVHAASQLGHCCECNRPRRRVVEQITHLLDEAKVGDYAQLECGQLVDQFE